MREKLAALCHKQWSGWMDYLFSKCVEEERFENGQHFKTGNLIIPKWAVERWKRQSASSYELLSSREQDSDRKEADRFLKILKENQCSKD